MSELEVRDHAVIRRISYDAQAGTVTEAEQAELQHYRDVTLTALRRERTPGDGLSQVLALEGARCRLD